MRSAHLAPIFREAARKLAEYECKHIGLAIHSVQPVGFIDVLQFLADLGEVYSYEECLRDEMVMYLLFAANWCESDDV